MILVFHQNGGANTLKRWKKKRHPSSEFGRAALMVLVAEIIDELNEDCIKLEEIAALREDILDNFDLSQIAQSIDQAVARMGRRAESFEYQCGYAVHAIYEGSEEVRAKQVELGYFGPIRIPDPMRELLPLIWLFTLIETLMMTPVLAFGSGLSVLSALGYSLVLSATTVATGLASGFLCLRYILSKPQWNKPYEGLKRNLAKVGFLASILNIGLIIFSGARLRANGTHEGFFFGGEVGLLETFNDGNTFLIATISFLSWVFATLKGFTSISDIHPDLTRLWRAVYFDRVEQLQEAADGLLDDLEAEFKALLTNLDAEKAEGLNKIKAYRGAVSGLASSFKKHNAKVERESNEIRKAIAQAQADEHYINGAGGSADFEDIDFQRLESFKRTPPADDAPNPKHVKITFKKELATLGGRLATGYHDACERIETALLKVELTRPDTRQFEDIDPDTPNKKGGRSNGKTPPHPRTLH